MSFLSQIKSKEFKDVYKLVCLLMARPECEPFRTPVDWQGMGLLDYPGIIKEPRDLGTIKKDIEDEKYDSVNDVVKDIRLVWTNCMLYNSTGNEFYHLADKFSRAFEDAYRAIRRLGDDEKDPLRTPTIEEKLQLTHDIFKIGNYELARVLTMIEDAIPSAIARKLAADEVLINLDAIPSETFHEISAYTSQCITNMAQWKKAGNPHSKKRKLNSREDDKIIDL